MADLSTHYLGLALKNPIVPSSSPLTGRLDSALRLQEAGAAAIVMPSLFEEKIQQEHALLDRFLDEQSLGHGEATSFRPIPADYTSSEDRYLETLQQLKSALDIPVIASLNGVTAGGWLECALAIQDAGADALELNVYYVPGDSNETGAAVEQRYLDIAAALRPRVSIPVTMKLSSQFSAPLDFVRKLEQTGVQGVCLFNRFYQPDIDLDTLAMAPKLDLSSSIESLLRVRWVGMLHGHTNCNLAVTGGFHTAADALKALLAGADVVHLCSALLQRGPGLIETLLTDMQRWLEDKEYLSVDQLRGSLSCRHAPNPSDYARANYIDVLDSYSVPDGVQF
ncbi:MAG: dihydroorotate dehydrogenase-like protein [Haliea sp.]|uniref:dihydroorotate dehydrogenase-like protein n=1 Tax=Haliea sp. TaxID=1932666 RepID=UPI0032EC0C7A